MTPQTLEDSVDAPYGVATERVTDFLINTSGTESASRCERLVRRSGETDAIGQTASVGFDQEVQDLSLHGFIREGIGMIIVILREMLLHSSARDASVAVRFG